MVLQAKRPPRPRLRQEKRQSPAAPLCSHLHHLARPHDAARPGHTRARRRRRRASAALDHRLPLRRGRHLARHHARRHHGCGRHLVPSGALLRKNPAHVGQSDALSRSGHRRPLRLRLPYGRQVLASLEHPGSLLRRVLDVAGTKGPRLKAPRARLPPPPDLVDHARSLAVLRPRGRKPVDGGKRLQRRRGARHAGRNLRCAVRPQGLHAARAARPPHCRANPRLRHHHAARLLHAPG